MADVDAEELGVAERAVAAISPGGSNSIVALVQAANSTRIPQMDYQIDDLLG